MIAERELIRPESRREKTVTPCNFRASGLLSKESLRQLRSMHETFARTLSHSLDLFLGSQLEVKLNGLDQVGAREFGSALPVGSYLVPFELQPTQAKIVAAFENDLLFPLLDLLLGGTGEPLEHIRELTEIDEELFRSVSEMVGAQLERIWTMINVSLGPLPSIKPAMIGQLFAIEERVLALHFEIKLTKTISSFALLLPITFCATLVRSSQNDAARYTGSEAGAMRRLADRLLECDIPLTIDLSGLRVPVGDLVTLNVGHILDLQAPAAAPIVMHVRGHPLFEVVPVRRGPYKAAQLKCALQHEG
ncbi:MAG TPA: FliM/FliN family flagellar motor switch protein [Acidobacteriaceae bacterium]